jgi:hypothetical protein
VQKAWHEMFMELTSGALRHNHDLLLFCQLRHGTVTLCLGKGATSQLGYYPTQGQCYKPFYDRKLRIFVIR